MQVIFLHSLFRTLSWTFIHSLWQGFILAIAAGLVMLITKRSAASLRYALLCTLFFLFLGGVAITFLVEWNAGLSNSPGLKLINNPAGIDAIFPHSLFGQAIEKLGFLLESNSQWIVLGWLIILGFKLARMIVEMMYLSRLRNHQISAPGDEWKIKLQSLSDELGIRKKVSLLQSALVRFPIVMGHLKPVILVPMGILTGLPVAEVEAVLLHELAHIRRHDYLVNFIQRVAEMLFFFNPALLWVSSLLRIERENCCDDIAIAKTKDKLRFVEALISFKEYSLRHPQYALGLFGKRNGLMQRVSRIVHNRNKTLSPFELVFFGINLFVFVFLISVSGKPATPEPSAPLLFARNVDPSLYFSTEPIRKVQPVSKKKTVSASKQVLLSSSVNRMAKLIVKIKEAVSQEQNFNAVQDLAESDRQLGKLQYQSLQQSRLQADKDREQAEKGRLQAEEDRKQADKDREQANKDRMQADKDRERAEQDRKQADKDREQADLDRKKADEDREEIEKARTRSLVIQTRVM
ncbi:MAG: M56 family metallopeptidase [Chitinophagaceae bacterium]